MQKTTTTFEEFKISRESEIDASIQAMMRKPRKLTTKCGLSELEPMTYSQARAWGERNMPAELRRAGFGVHVFCATMAINGWIGYRINYGK